MTGRKKLIFNASKAILLSTGPFKSEGNQLWTHQIILFRSISKNTNRYAIFHRDKIQELRQILIKTV